MTQTVAKPAAKAAGKAMSKTASKTAGKTASKAAAEAPVRLAGKSAAEKPAPEPATAPAGESPAQLIDARIAALGDWRGQTLARVRALIHQALPDVVEEWKWRGVPVWYQSGMLCTGETYKNVVKLTFAKGAALPDPSKLFNSSLDGNVRRAIDIPEGVSLDEAAFKALVRAAAALNGAKKASGR